MSVYVDQALFPYRGQMWCHMWADDVLELHLMAGRLGLRREWFQEPPKASWQHYDLAPGRRASALRYGAIETDRYGPSYFTAQREGRAEVIARIDRLRARTKAEALAAGMGAKASPYAASDRLTLPLFPERLA